MKQDAFEARYAPLWTSMEAWLTASENTPLRKRDQSWADGAGAFPQRYRELCHHLALARQRQYSPALEERLNRLALRGHRHLYRPRTQTLNHLLEFFAAGLPMAFRQHWPFMLASFVLFFGTFFALIATVLIEPDLVHAVMDSESLLELESMYEPNAEHFGVDRGSGGDFERFGFYIFNNTSIGLRAIAGGVLGGLGTLLTLVFNGVFLGAAAGHLTAVGYHQNFWSFVIGHGSLELTAIMVSGGAGLRLGYAVWAPGRYRRADALALAARQILPLVLGAALMFIAAAVIEAFWSSTVWLPTSSKFLVGAILWLLVALYFGFMGRARGS